MRHLASWAAAIPAVAAFVLLGGGAARAAAPVPSLAAPVPSPAVPSPAVPSSAAVPLAAAPQTPALVQRGDGAWTTTAEVGTAALCAGPVSFDLVTTSPDRDTPDPRPGFAGGLRCGAGPGADTEVSLVFTLPAIPRTATLVITPSAPVLAQGVPPLDIGLAVSRHVSAFDYLWIPVGCGAGLALVLVGLTMLIGVPRPGGTPAHTHRQQFWRLPLYASSAWTFGDSWATNITAVGSLVGALLTTSGTVSALLPGVEVGRFSLLIALAGGITVAAPLLFGLLNSQFGNVDPTTAGVAVIWLPAGAPDRRVTVKVPASATISVCGGGQETGVPAGGTIEIAPPAASGSAGFAQVLALPGTNDIAVAPGSLITASGGAPLTAASGATISFLGRASLTLPAGTRIEAPVAEPGRPARRSVLRYRREFAIPHSGEMVAAEMWSMLAAAAMTTFGIGAEIGITGIVLGFNLAAAPLWARGCGLAIAIAAAALVAGYGVSAIRALADSREGSALSGPRGSSFTL
jgi:hypothetical protein